jgi:hypothetical protein
MMEVLVEASKRLFEVPKFESPEEAYAVLLEMNRIALTTAQQAQQMIDKLLLAIKLLTVVNLAFIVIAIIQLSR